MISLENVERSYKTGAGQTWVLRRIHLKIQAGEFITIMGPSVRKWTSQDKIEQISSRLRRYACGKDQQTQ